MLSKSCKFIRNVQMARGIVSKSVSKGFEISKRLEASLKNASQGRQNVGMARGIPAKCCQKEARAAVPRWPVGGPRGGGWIFEPGPPLPRSGSRDVVEWRFGALLAQNRPEALFGHPRGDPPGPLGRPPRPSLTAFLRGVLIAGGHFDCIFTWGPNCRGTL